MELSIIIVNFNQQEFLRKCLASVYRNAASVDFEVIVVDNHSSDGSVDMIREKFPAVKIIVNSENKGFAAANNQAAKLSAGQFLMFLNSDAEVLAQAIETLLGFIKNCPGSGLVGAKLLNPDGSAQRQGRPLLAFWKSKKPKKVSFLPATAVIMKKELFEKLGGFDEKFFFYNEDLDLGRRILKAGYKIYFVPQARIIHFGGESTRELGKTALVEGYLGGLRYCYKHYPWWVFYFYRLLVAAELGLKKFFSYFKKGMAEKRAAWCEILKRSKNDEKIYQ